MCKVFLDGVLHTSQMLMGISFHICPLRSIDNIQIMFDES